MIHPFDPYSNVRLQGDSHTRGVTLVLPTDRVRALLPHGLELGAQSFTPPGTHPVVMLFHEMYRAHMSIPTLLPNMTYREHSIGVPFAYIARGWIDSMSSGPYYFMPKLHLDDFWATLGGLVYWGLPKNLARFSIHESGYEVMERDGRPITSISVTAAHGDFMRAQEHENFAPIRDVLNQPIISMMPVAMGPFFVVCHFDKDWSRADLRSIETCMHIDRAYVPGLPTGSFQAPGLDQHVLGSYEYRAPWRMSLPYPPRRAWW